MIKNFKIINFLLLNWCLSLATAEPESKEEKPKEQIDFAVGGQAVIEGVMMRSPNHTAIAVRKPNGDIAIQHKPYTIIIQRYPWLNIPLVRGMINLFEMMVVGTKAINYSAEQAMMDEDLEEETNEGKSKLQIVGEFLMFSLSFVLAMAFSLALFKFLPLWITTFLEQQFPVIADNYVLFNLIDGALKMLVFISYIFTLSLFNSFYRVFQYHGAEHKSIFAYEQNLPLTVENAAAQTRFHPRCGTSFVFIVFSISIILYTFVPKQESFWMNFGLRIAVLPLIAGVSYEYLKLSAKYVEKAIVKAMVQPGLWFQKLTTKEPDSSQLEVGLKSLKVALEAEEGTTAKVEVQQPQAAPSA